MRKDESITNLQGIDKRYEINGHTYYLNGEIEAVFDGSYICSPLMSNIDTLKPDFSAILSRLCGEYIIILTKDDELKFIARDTNCVRKEVYYAIKDEKLVISDNFFELAKEMGYVELDKEELSFFISFRYCRSGKTIFKNVNRIPPGRTLSLKNGNVCLYNYLDSFQGANITYDIFKKAFESSFKSIISNYSADKDIVLLSGVDSSVILGMLNRLGMNVHAIAIQYEPKMDENIRDVERARKIVKPFQIDNEIVNVDFNDVKLDALDKMPFLMPFSAHLSIHFLKLFEYISNMKKVRVWSGQNADSLYNLGPTGKLALIHRLLLSDTYISCLKGVRGYRKFSPVKNVVDFGIKNAINFLGRRQHITYDYIETPESIDELIEFFSKSDNYLALSFSRGTKNMIKNGNDITVDEARKKLFDNKLGSFLTGGDPNVVYTSAEAFNVPAFLPYSYGNMVQLFRNMHRGLKNVIFPKRFLYKYAKKDLSIPSSFYNLKIPAKGLDYTSWENSILKSTCFGNELLDFAKDISTLEIFNGLRQKDDFNLQHALDYFWVGKIYDILRDDNIEIRI